MTKTLCFLSTLLLSASIFAATPKSFKEIESMYNNGSKPDMSKIAETNLQGGCFTPYSDMIFTNELELQFTRGQKGFDAIYVDQKTGEKTEFHNLIEHDNFFETQNEKLSTEAYFKMGYKQSNDIVIEKISMHTNEVKDEFVVNLCFYKI